MAKKGYTPEQIINKLREAEILLSQGATIVLVSKKIGVSDHTYYRWRKEYGGMRVEQARRLKELEQENYRLKKLVALGRMGILNLLMVSMLKLSIGVKSGERLLIATGASTSFGQAYALSIQWAQSSKRDEVSSLRVDMGNPGSKFYQLEVVR